MLNAEFGVSDKAMGELGRNFFCSDEAGYMRLNLGLRDGCYPVLILEPNGYAWRLKAIDSDGNGKEQERPITPSEIDIFLQAARHSAPGTEVTKRLIIESAKRLKS
jgi:hypothetical protein